VPPSLLLRVLEDVYSRVEMLGVFPVVAGGLAVSYWGHPRSTQDIDLADIKTLYGLHQATLVMITCASQPKSCGSLPSSGIALEII
jgi:hypothetical protein